MYLRLVRLHIREGSLWQFREHYESHILPALEATDGCLYAALLQPLARTANEDCDSLTLWESVAQANVYVESGRYDELLDGADPYLASATEWKADPFRPPSGQRPPLPDPTVEVYPVEVARQAPGGGETNAVFLRVVDHRVEPARFEELMRTYEDEVARGTGCGRPSGPTWTKTTSASVTFTCGPPVSWRPPRSASTSTATVTEVVPTRRVRV